MGSKVDALIAEVKDMKRTCDRTVRRVGTLELTSFEQTNQVDILDRDMNRFVSVMKHNVDNTDKAIDALTAKVDEIEKSMPQEYPNLKIAYVGTHKGRSSNEL